jgi:DNA repair protein SbcC/Rad50
MKPIELELWAFGSFAGHEKISFESLAPRGLFVVSGDTGTGKTTIFDAMCWALYGEMPLKESQGVRSDHVAAEVRTEVRFTFECDGERYVVTRNPEQVRPAVRGTGHAKEEANAHLVRITAVGTEPVASRARPTSDACEQIIGLDAKQFQRVILLPQGEFSRFLLADTPEREKLLSKLFGGKVFDDIVVELKTEHDRLRKELGATDAQIEAQLDAARTNLRRAFDALTEATPDDLDLADRARATTIAAMLDEPLATRRDEVATLTEAAEQAATARATADAAAQRHDQAAAHQAALDALDASQAQVTADAAAAEASAAARPVVVAADALDSATEEANDATERRDAVVTKVTAGLADLGIEADATKVGALAKQLTDARSTNAAHTAALTAAANAAEGLERAQEAQTATSTELAEHRAELVGAHDTKAQIEVALPAARAAAVDPAALEAAIAAASALVVARCELDEVQQRALAAATQASTAAEAARQVLATFVATQAPRLADTLEDGEPCPVCGATEHPRPATGDGADPTDLDEVEAAGAARDAANEQAKATEAELAALRAKLGDHATAAIEELQARVTDLHHELAAARSAAAEVGRLEGSLERATADVQRLEHAIAGLEERARATEAQVEEATAAKVTADEAATGIDADEVARAATTIDQLEPLVAGLEALFTDAATTAAHVASCRAKLADTLDASPNDTVEAARAVLLPPPDEAAALAAAHRHQAQRTAATAALGTLVELGIPDERPDVDAAHAAASAADDACKLAAGALKTADDALTYVREALSEHDRILDASGETRTHAEVVRLAYEVCNHGGGGAAMSLKRWVLTRELDRVTAAANVHLQRMTNQRYRLQRKEARTDGRKAFGLDLEVVDANTSRARATRSLSGGEQFQASLALALGLADVVSHGGTASGKSFEALFVDEGFGSLSARSLDDAIETLHQLHATGRMVGAITHVEAMKENLHVGIEVTPREDGRGSTLAVHP